MRLIRPTCPVCAWTGPRQVEIVFPVASEAVTATGEQGEGEMKAVPGVSGEGPNLSVP